MADTKNRQMAESRLPKADRLMKDHRLWPLEGSEELQSLESQDPASVARGVPKGPNIQSQELRCLLVWTDAADNCCVHMAGDFLVPKS